MPRTEHVVSADDTDKLIELVKQHPLLYDPTSAEHKDAQKMFNTWASIAAIMDREKMTGMLHFKSKVYLYLHVNNGCT